jgi:hypothetical protein
VCVCVSSVSGGCVLMVLAIDSEYMSLFLPPSLTSHSSSPHLSLFPPNFLIPSPFSPPSSLPLPLPLSPLLSPSSLTSISSLSPFR